MDVEKLTKPENLHGYRQAVVLIESQSAPILMGDQTEQRYMRGFQLCEEGDVVVTDFKLNQTYLDYLRLVLGFALPEFVVVPNVGGGCLAENITADKKSLDLVESKLPGRVLQFFNLTGAEFKLVEMLGADATCGDLEMAIEIGSKPGFRKICEKLGMSTPWGFVCSDLESTIGAAMLLFEKNADGGVMIKSKNGTGGAELKSNLWLPKIQGETDAHLETRIIKALESLNGYLGDEWTIEEWVEGQDGSIHVFIKDEFSAEPAFVLGSISHDNSYVGGYYPFEVSADVRKMIDEVNTVYVSEMQRLGVFGHHCLDIRGNYYLEDNIRPGALDYIDGLVRKVARVNHLGSNLTWYHKHIDTSKPTTFEIVYDLLGNYMNPNTDRGWFVIVTNQEVLPFGRALDLTVVMNQGDVKEAAEIFEGLKKFLEGKI